MSESAVPRVRSIAAEFVEEIARGEAETGGWRKDDQSFPLIEAAMDQMLERLSAIGLWGEANRMLVGEVWKVAGHVLQHGRLQRRAREKPRGYAGDYELFEWIGGREHCDHPLGRHFDRYFQRQPAAEAVRYRARSDGDTIRERVTRAGARRICIVGAGPARDARHALEAIDARQREAVSITLLDVDPAALDFAGQKLSQYLPAERISARRVNLFRLPESDAQAAALDGADVILCPGLFDYLAGTDASAMLRCFHGRLAPGGWTGLFNFTPENRSRAYMEWIGDWRILHRTGEEMLRIAAAAGIPESEALAREIPGQPLVQLTATKHADLR